MKFFDKLISVFFIAFIALFCVGTCINMIFSKSAEKKENFETYFKENIFLRDYVIDFHGLTQRVIRNKVIEDVRYGVLLKNDWKQLTDVPFVSDLKELKENIYKISDASKKSGANMVYVQAPFKILPSYEDILPVSYKSYANENADKLIRDLKKREIECFDLRPVLEQSPLIKSQIFYKTDHHWTIPAAFYSYGQLTEFLNEKYSYIDPRELSFLTNELCFEKKELPSSFLGTWGRRTGKFYCEPDDFIYYVPNFATDIEVEHIGDNIFHERSSFYYTMMTPDYVENSCDGIKTNRYSVYLGGYTKETKAVNYNVSNNSKILIFHDSFGFPLSAFISLTFKETRILDLRNYKGDFEKYIENYKPDIVLAIYNPDY